MTLQELYDKRGSLVKEQRDLLDSVKDGENLSAEQEERFEAIDQDIQALTKRIERECKLKDLEDETRAANEIDRSTLAPGDGARSVDEVTREYRDAYVHFLRTGDERRLHEVRDYTGDAQVIGDDGDGGYLAPDEFARELLKKARDETPMRQVAKVRQTSSGQLTIPYRDSYPAAERKAEKATYATGNIEFLTTTIDCHKITASIAVSEEMLTDSVFDIEEEILEAMAESISDLENTWFTAGTGTNQAYGVVTGASAGVTAAAVDAITADELMELYHAPKKKYRNNATWMFEDATALLIRKLKDGNSQYMWQPGLQAGQPDRLLGRPVLQNEAMVTVATGVVPVIFGDLGRYIIADRAGVRIIRDPYTYAREGMVIFSASRRTGGRLPLDEAVKKLTMA